MANFSVDVRRGRRMPLVVPSTSNAAKGFWLKVVPRVRVLVIATLTTNPNRSGTVAAQKGRPPKDHPAPLIPLQRPVSVRCPKVIPGRAVVPLTNFIGAIGLRSPSRVMRLLSSLAMSARVGLAQLGSITVPSTTGLPAGSE
jgi:hypothetical protein